MKKFIIGGIFLTAVFLSFSAFTNQVTAVEITNPLKYDTFTQLINAIIDFLFVVSLALSSLMIVLAGYYFVTASGDPKKIEAGKKIILYTLIGLGIIMFAKAISSILKLVIGLKQ